MKLVLKIFGVALLIAFIIWVIYYFTKKKPATNAPAGEPNVTPVTSVGDPNSVSGQVNQLTNASNANKKVYAKANGIKPYTFQNALTNDFPSYEESKNPLEVFNKDILLGTYGEGFSAWDNTSLLLQAQKAYDQGGSSLTAFFARPSAANMTLVNQNLLPKGGWHNEGYSYVTNAGQQNIPAATKYFFDPKTSFGIDSLKYMFRVVDPSGNDMFFDSKDVYTKL